MTRPAWIAADWGTSNLRVWALDADDKVLAEATSSTAGMNRLKPNEFEPALLKLIKPWLGKKCVDVIACGMVGARQGWIEAPYAKAPCVPTTSLVEAPVSDRRIRVHICGGVSQDDPADVMRGEETQLAGFLAHKPDYRGVVCLPGTHTKWVWLSGGRIRRFRTFMTGEIYQLLAEKSVLRHSVAKAGWDHSEYLQVVQAALANPGAADARLFSLRAASLLGEQDPGIARARLSGLLIGMELAGVWKEYRRTRQVAVIGSKELTEHYSAALLATGYEADLKAQGRRGMAPRRVPRQGRRRSGRKIETGHAGKLVWKWDTKTHTLEIPCRTDVTVHNAREETLAGLLAARLRQSGRIDEKGG